MRLVASLLVLAALGMPVLAQDAPDAPLWMRYPAVSPDGSTIAFSYRGDLWTVDAHGGAARPLTLNEARDFAPVWSPDGRSLAFASDRFGNFDVFVVSAEGGPARRMTYHSAADQPSAFTPDGSAVVFMSSRMDDVRNSQFPIGVLPELYSVPMEGGTPTQLLTTPAIDARFSPDGQRIAYHDQKGYEDAWRKHHTSSIARDVWVYDVQSGSHTQLSDFAGEDRNPVWSPDGSDLFYLSERSGSFNVWSKAADGSTEPTQVTRHERHPVRFLTSSTDGDLVYGFDGEIWRLAAGTSAPAKVEVQLNIEDRFAAEEREQLTDGATEMALSPNEKEIAFVVRGEVFVTAVDFGTTKRVTTTPGQERSISFSPDGRSILYASERDGSWDVYETSITRDEEPLFSQATLLEERAVVATAAEEFQPRYSPDGDEVAYLEERVVLRVVPRRGGAARTILPAELNYSYEDGDQWYRWSPDGEQFLVNYNDRGRYMPEVGLVSALGGSEPVNLTNSGYADMAPSWAIGGTAMTWVSDRLGLKAYNAFGDGAQVDVFALFFTQTALDEFERSKEERELLQTTKDSVTASGDEDEGSAEIEIDLEGIDDRIRRLTIHSSDVAGAELTRDGSKLVYLSQFERGYDLWMHDFIEGSTSQVAKLGAREATMTLDSAGTAAFILADGKLSRVPLAGADRTPIAFAAEMDLRSAEERAYLFEHVWRQVDKKFYVTDLHGVDWTFYRDAYARFLPHVNNNHDFQELLSEMLGELNASHTGARFRPTIPEADSTAALGVFFDRSWEGQGLRIAEFVAKGPLSAAASRAEVGAVVEAIDGTRLDEETNYYSLLNRKAGRRVLLSFRNPQTGEQWDETVEPITLAEESQLLYERWVESRRAEVDRLSEGRLGYVHVRAMDDPSFRETYAELLGRNADKEAVVVDTRFNGGGWLHDDLVTLLGGERYVSYKPRGQDLGGDPFAKWQRPSIVVMGESNYSDAHMFPFAYREKELGELVGMPVPGTGTAVWWETLQDPSLVFGIPEMGMVDRNGRYLENQQLEPDHRVMNDPESVARGEDLQLEKAVERLLEIVRRGPIS